MKTLGEESFLGELLFAFVFVLFVAGPIRATTWYVKGDANPNGHGNGDRPFSHS